MNDSTKRGNLPGVLRPYWLRIKESEERLGWLKNILRQDLVVRDVEAYAKACRVQLRTEDMRCREAERVVLMGIMKVKIKYEIINLRGLIAKRETVRKKDRQEIGNTKYLKLVAKLRQEVEVRGKVLRNKFSSKIEYLKEIREKEEEEKERILPKELEEYSECKVFNKDDFEKLKPIETKAVRIGKVELDDNEEMVLRMYLKFVHMRRLSANEMETDVEVCLSKIRLEAAQQEERKKLENVDYEIGEGKRRKIEYSEMKGEDMETLTIY